MSSTIKSDNSDLTINADGSNEIKFQANGVEKASISSAGAFTSTTIDATKLTGALPAIDGSSLTNLPGGGKVLQVVTGTSGSEANSTSGTYVDTGLSATITPTLSSSKILVIGSENGGAKKSGNCYGALQLVRGSTSLYVPHSRYGFTNNSEWIFGFSLAFHYLDSPSTTSATTYKTQFKLASGSGTVRVQDNAAVSTITLIEIGA